MQQSWRLEGWFLAYTALADARGFRAPGILHLDEPRSNQDIFVRLTERAFSLHDRELQRVNKW